MRGLKIGQVAQQANVGVETIRFYERKGLIERPARPVSGFRRYPPEVVDRVRFYQHAKGLGFSLREAAELLALRLNPEVSCGDVRTRALAKVSDIEAKVRALERMRGILTDLISRCSGEGPTGDCPILHALEESKPLAGETEQQ
jgi:MerR family mercuric resistance operon transcriptional regulator